MREGSVTQDLLRSLRGSFNFRPNPGEEDPPNGSPGGGVVRIAERIGSCLRKSRVGLGIGLGFIPKSPSPSRRFTMAFAQGATSPMRDVEPEENPPIRWKKGELIGHGAFGHVYMGMNLDSGELLAVKQVLIGTSNASRETAQEQLRNLEIEVNVLKKLSHPNIVRYLGTVREGETLNILLEFVPGGSISSLLSKFGSFTEAVIRTYTKQLLQGLEYLHKNKIIHRDIKGANILVDNKGCIKLADFGASKQELTTPAKSMKGTPHWMAPEVIDGSGHDCTADIWSVGCTVIEMATGKPPWIQQYEMCEALMFHVGRTRSHPPIPEHLSPQAKDFLLKCLQEEPLDRPSASELLQHSFVTGEPEDSHPLNNGLNKESSNSEIGTNKFQMGNSWSKMDSEKAFQARPIWETNSDDDMCQFADPGGDFQMVGESFNPMSEPIDDEWQLKFDRSLEQRNLNSNVDLIKLTKDSGSFEYVCEDDDEVTESKIRAFIDEKALELKKLQTPLYEEYYNSLNATNPRVDTVACKENITNNVPRMLPTTPPNKGVSSPLSVLLRTRSTKKNPSCHVSRCSVDLDGGRVLKEIESTSPSSSFSEKHLIWEKELKQELEEKKKIQQAAFGKREHSRVR